MLGENRREQNSERLHTRRFPSAALTASFANSDIRQRVETIFSVANRKLRKLLCLMMIVFNGGTNCLISLLRQNPLSSSPPRPSFLFTLIRGFLTKGQTRWKDAAEFVRKARVLFATNLDVAPGSYM